MTDGNSTGGQDSYNSVPEPDSMGDEGKFGFSCVPAWVLFCVDCPQELAVYVFLRLFVFPGQEHVTLATPTMKMISEAIGIRPAHKVKKYVDGLCRKGAIKIIKSRNPKTGRYDQNKYILAWQPPKQMVDKEGNTVPFDAPSSLKAWKDRYFPTPKEEENPHREVITYRDFSNSDGDQKNKTAGKDHTPSGVDGKTTKSKSENTQSNPSDKTPDKAHAPSGVDGSSPNTPQGAWLDTPQGARSGTPQGAPSIPPLDLPTHTPRAGEDDDADRCGARCENGCVCDPQRVDEKPVPSGGQRRDDATRILARSIHPAALNRMKDLAKPNETKWAMVAKVEKLLDHGWSPDELIAKISPVTNEATTHPVSVINTRLAELSQASPESLDAPDDPFEGVVADSGDSQPQHGLRQQVEDRKKPCGGGQCTGPWMRAYCDHTCLPDCYGNHGAKGPAGSCPDPGCQRLWDEIKPAEITN